MQQGAANQFDSTQPDKILGVVISTHPKENTPFVDIKNFERAFRNAGATAVGGPSDDQRNDLRGVAKMWQLRHIFEDAFTNARKYKAICFVIFAPGNNERIDLDKECPTFLELIQEIDPFAIMNTDTSVVLMVVTSKIEPQQEHGPQPEVVLSNNTNLLVIQAHDSGQTIPGFERDFYGSWHIYKLLKHLEASNSILESVGKVNEEAERKTPRIQPLRMLESGFVDFKLTTTNII